MVTRLKPTAEALEARKGLAARELLEVRTAERDRAVDVVESLERIVTRVGGYMTPADQDVLGAARQLLVEAGRKTSEQAVWSDRVKCDACSGYFTPDRIGRHHCTR